MRAAPFFDRAAFPKSWPKDADPVDEARVADPTHDRFVLCGPGDRELGRFALLEDAGEAARTYAFKTTTYALRSGVVMAYSVPGGAIRKERR